MFLSKRPSVFGLVNINLRLAAGAEFAQKIEIG